MFGIVIDKNGLKVDFVNVFDNGEIDSYEIKDGEQLITQDWQKANSMLKPMWTGSEWVETATEEELNERFPEPEPRQPTAEERI